MMRKRALSPPPDHSSSSSSSHSRQLCARFQLLHDLPASLFSAVCSFLTLYQVVSILRSTCRALHGSVSEDCLQHHHLAITDDTLPSLVASRPSTRALVRRISSLAILHRCKVKDSSSQSAMTLRSSRSSPLQAALDASRLQFSSLSSLYINVEEVGRQRARTPPKLRSLLSLLRLLAANPQLFSSLRRLDIQDYCDDRGEVVVPLPVPELARLQGLTHFRIQLQHASALSCPSLVSALSSMQCLTSLHIDDIGYGVWPKLLPLLCSDAATPLLLRLKSLVLPIYHDGEDDDRFDVQHDAFLCRLSSLPAPPALQNFSGMDVKHRAAGLVSVFSLPHLTQLNLEGEVQETELCAFASSFVSSPAPLVSLLLPYIKPEPEDDGKDEAVLAEAAVCTAMRPLLSRLTVLRCLSCAAAELDGATCFIDSLPSDGVSGCCASLYSLTVPTGRLHRCPFTARLSFPLLTELVVILDMMEAELELLLSGCPQLLKLCCGVGRSCCRTALIAARCCPRLLSLSVSGMANPSQPAQQARDAALAKAELDFSGPFLPELISLSLIDTGEPRPQPELSLLWHFATPPWAELRYFEMVGVGITAQHVLSLACLSGLSYLHVRPSWTAADEIAELEEANRRTHQRLLSRGAAARADRNAPSRTALREDCEGNVGQPAPALGPHQQQEMKLRVLQEAEEFQRGRNWLAAVEGVDPDTARAVFFDELRSVLTAAAASGVSGSEGRW